MLEHSIIMLPRTRPSSIELPRPSKLHSPGKGQLPDGRGRNFKPKEEVHEVRQPCKKGDRREDISMLKEPERGATDHESRCMC